MPEVSFSSLAVIMGAAFAAPLALGLFPRVRVPAVVVEIVLGIVIGPSVLGWAEADEVVRVLAIVGLAFLLFLAGLELDLRHLRGPLARVAARGFGLSLLLAGACGLVLTGLGLVDDPLLAAVILTATSLGLVIPSLKETGATGSPLGQLVIAGASIGDFAAILLLSALFSMDGGGAGAQLVLLVEFAVVVGLVAVGVGVSGRSEPVSSLLVRLQDTTAEIRVRGAVLLLVVLVVLAERFGLETILGAFIAGAVVGLVDRDVAMTHPQFRVKLDAIGYGFVIPGVLRGQRGHIRPRCPARRAGHARARADLPGGPSGGPGRAGRGVPAAGQRQGGAGGRAVPGHVAAVHRHRQPDRGGDRGARPLDGRRLHRRRPGIGAGVPRRRPHPAAPHARLPRGGRGRPGGRRGLGPPSPRAPA